MWFKWFLVSVHVLQLIITPYEIGKPRTPRTAGDAAILSGMSVLVICGLLYYWR